MAGLTVLGLLTLPVSTAVAQAAAQPEPAAETSPEFQLQPAAQFTRDTPVADIAANPAGKAVLDQDIPGLLSDPAYPLFKHMSLKQMQEMSDGELSAEAVDKAETDLKALAAAR